MLNIFKSWTRLIPKFYFSTVEDSSGGDDLSGGAGSWGEFDWQSYLPGVSVDPAIAGFLPGTGKLETAKERMLGDIDFYRKSLGFGQAQKRNQYQGQIAQMFGGQGLMSGMGGGFGKKNQGIIRNIDKVRSAYSSDMASGLLGYQRDVASAQYGYEDAQSDYQESLINRLIQLDQAYEDEDYITFS